MIDDEKRRETLKASIPAGSSILDVGCVRHNEARRKRGNLHAELQREYSDVVGIDLPGPELDRMQEEYPVYPMDCQEIDFDRSFDVIVAGEVIEHLPNPGLFLSSASEHLNERGRILLSTPNPNYIGYQYLAFRNRWTSDEHTCWISPYQLETLVDRTADMRLRIEWVQPPGRLTSLWPLHKRLLSPTYIGCIS